MTAISRINTAFRGQQATNQIAVQKDAGISEEVSAEIPFGIMVAVGSANDGMKLLAASTDDMKGILLQNHDFAKDNELGDLGLKPGVAGDLMVRGRAYVWAEAAMVVGNAVHVRWQANGGNTQVGTFRATKDAGHTLDISSFARVVQDGDATNPPVIEIDMLFQANAVVS